MEPRSFVLTLIGPDKPGLVDTLATAVAEHGGNWAESRMIHLGGQFAGLLRVELPEDQRDALLQALGRLQDDGLRIVAGPPAAAPLPQAGMARMEIVGQDRPGIVREISRSLATRSVNVEELSTSCESAPMSGERLFKADLWIAIPDGCDLAALRGDLERIAADLLVEVKFESP